MSRNTVILGLSVLAFCAAMQFSTVYKTVTEKSEEPISQAEYDRIMSGITPIVDVNETVVEIDKTTIQQEDTNKSFEYFKENYASHLSDDEAQSIFDSIVTAANKWDTDYRAIIPLIYSESRFKPDVKHKHKKIVGVGGIHKGIWTKELKAQGIIDSAEDLDDTDKNIEASVYIFKYYYDRNKSNVFEALHSYKGRGYDNNLKSTGYSLAMKVYKNYLQIASNI